VAYDNRSGSGRRGQDLDDTGRDRGGLGGPGWSGLDSRGGRGQPWFGPKQFGFGYGPRTWQGYLVSVASLALVVSVGSATKARGALFFVVIGLVIAVHLAIIAIQRRR
jgi:hypothetical protein